MNGGIVSLSLTDLALASCLILALSSLSLAMGLGLVRSLIIAALRTVLQLLLIGLVLKVVFAQSNPLWVFIIALIMLLVAGREVMARQQRPFLGWWGPGLGTAAMFISSFSITIFVLFFVVQVKPWYTPQYAIPLLGMMLGNTMNGIALGLDRLTQQAWQQRAVIDARLALGQEPALAIADIRRESVRTGLIPMINAMAAAGIVSLPGMMTGQILAGVDPVVAVNYQVLIMFMVTAGTGFGTIAAIVLGARRLFDERQRLRLERLKGGGEFYQD
jgi:putative ABC transport system permease protein